MNTHTLSAENTFFFLGNSRSVTVKEHIHTNKILIFLFYQTHTQSGKPRSTAACRHSADAVNAAQDDLRRGTATHSKSPRVGLLSALSHLGHLHAAAEQ